MKKMLLLLALAPIISSGAGLLSVTPGPGPWPERWEEKLYEVNSLSGKVVDVVFVGDSITHGWDRDGVGRGVWFKRFVKPGYKVLNLGFGGDRTEHTLWRIQQGSLDGYKAKVIVLMIGTNNTGHRNLAAETPIDTIIGIKTVIDAIRERQSGAKIVLLPIFPRGATPDDPLRKRNEMVNAEIHKFADGELVFWLDFNRKFLTEDGTLTKEMMPDFLHPRAKGYGIWADAVIPAFEWFLDEKVRKAPGAESPFPAGYLQRCNWSVGSRVALPSEDGKNTLWWYERMKEKAAQKASVRKFDIVMLGDSITHRWEQRGTGLDVYRKLTGKYSVLNTATGGDRWEQVLWVCENGMLDGVDAKVVMLLAGANNHRFQDYDAKASRTVEGIASIIKVIKAKQPKAKIILSPILPRLADKTKDGEDRVSFRTRDFEVNDQLVKLADGKSVYWLDFRGPMLEALKKDDKAKLELTSDFTHLSEKMFAHWHSMLEPLLKEFCGK
jgi:beta-glucosidase